jgi:4,5-dihydroxyphthalate decarboxylase
MTAARLDLSIALSDNENTQPVLKGLVQAEGMKLFPTCVHPSEMFWRQLKFGDFDISEMSMSSLIIATSKGPTDWVAIPVFTSRHFFHTMIWVRNDRGINTVADLKGKRVAIPEYQQTAAIWTRGVLEHEFGVRAQDMEWFMERNPDKSHGGSTGFQPPAGVKLNYIPPTTNIGEMLVKGEIDCALHYLVAHNLVDRSKIDLSQDPNLRQIFPDIPAEKHRYFTKTGIYPINHTVVIRRSLHEKYPWLALNLYTMFQDAKAHVRAELMAGLKHYNEAGVLDANARNWLSQDLLGYGIKGPRKVLETITQYVHEQGLSSRRVGLEELFAPSTMDL